jgi:hypothetical protein
MGFEKRVNKLFKKYVRPLGLPPRLAGQCRHAMTEAADKAEGDSGAIKAAIPEYLKSRGYDEKGNKVGKPTKPAKDNGDNGSTKKAKKSKKEKKAKKDKKNKKDKSEDDGGSSTSSNDVPKKKSAPTADPAKDAIVESGNKAAIKGDVDKGVPKGNIDLTKLDRKSLKGMARDLGARYKKAMSDDEVRASVAKAMTGIDPTAWNKIANADPVKIEGLDSCIGALIDLTQMACIVCPSQEECRKLFEQHRQDGFKNLDALAKGAAVVPVSNLTKETNKLATYNASAKVEVFPFKKVAKLPSVKVDEKDVTNADHEDFLRAVRKSVPTNLGEFRDVVLKHYETHETDKEGTSLTMWFARYCTALGVIKVA